MAISRFIPLGAAILLVMTGCSPTKSIGNATPAPATPAQPVLALFTDYGWDDPYVAQMKGSILTANPDARMVDITHSVVPFGVKEGSYILDQAAADFPAGTIFVGVVDPQVGTARDPILVQTAKDHYYVGPDNGLFTYVIDREGFTKAWKLDKPEFFRAGDPSHTFHGRDIFGPIGAHLAAGSDPDTLGSPLPQKSITMLPTRDATFAGGTLTVEVLHVDHYGNVILNLARGGEAAAKLKEGNLVKISVGKESFAGPLIKTYGEMEKGRLILLYNGSGLLEIAMNQGSAAKELKVDAGALILLKP